MAGQRRDSMLAVEGHVAGQWQGLMLAVNGLLPHQTKSATATAAASRVGAAPTALESPIFNHARVRRRSAADHPSARASAQIGSGEMQRRCKADANETHRRYCKPMGREAVTRCEWR